jgi:hypothetical protein
MGNPSAQPASSLEGILYRGVKVHHIRHLGEGKSALVSLVKDSDGPLVAEKRFTRGGVFARTLYKLSFQAPLPYHTDVHAVASAFYTRKLLREFTRIWYGTCRVADSLYIRRDVSTGELILGTEYVKGRGPDPNMRNSRYEIGGLKEYMDDLSKRLLETGMYGVIWQTDRSLSVPSSNFLQNSDGHWILVDAEPGLPGIAFFRSKEYLSEARRKGMFPLFGDVDLDRLETYIKGLKVDMKRKRLLMSYYRALKHHLVHWKTRELASHRTAYDRWGTPPSPERKRVLYGEDFRRRFGSSPAALKLIGRSWFLTLAYLLISDSMHAFFTEEGKARWHERRYQRLERNGRIPAGTRKGLLTHTILSLFFFKEMHRWLVDPKIREEYGQFGFYYLESLVKEWDSLGRLLPYEKKHLLSSKESGNANIRGFGYHLLLKPLSLIFDSVSIGGVILTGSWVPLLIMLIAPALRVIATCFVWVQERLKGRKHSVGVALLVGAIPKAGILGFPAQLYHKNRAVFCLISDNMLSGMGERVPIFGATNSTLEHWFIRRNFLVRKERFCNGHDNKAPGPEPGSMPMA